MKLQLMGGACQRVHQVLEQGMSEGMLSLPPELTAHAARCPRCGPEVRETEVLLGRLMRGAAGIDLSPVPRVVDQVMARTAMGHGSGLLAAAPPAAATPAAITPERATAERSASGEAVHRQADWKWVLGQIAAVAAAFLIAISGLTYGVLKINQAVSGTSPGEVIAKLTQPFHDWTQARFHGGR